ncbi:unnamed protein product, partial [Ascophyllum nodosum]
VCAYRCSRNTCLVPSPRGPGCTPERTNYCRRRTSSTNWVANSVQSVPAKCRHLGGVGRS